MVYANLFLLNENFVHKLMEVQYLNYFDASNNQSLLHNTETHRRKDAQMLDDQKVFSFKHAHPNIEGCLLNYFLKKLWVSKPHLVEFVG